MLVHLTRSPSVVLLSPSVRPRQQAAKALSIFLLKWQALSQSLTTLVRRLASTALQAHLSLAAQSLMEHPTLLSSKWIRMILMITQSSAATKCLVLWMHPKQESLPRSTPEKASLTTEDAAQEMDASWPTSLSTRTEQIKRIAYRVGGSKGL